MNKNKINWLLTIPAILLGLVFFYVMWHIFWYLNYTLSYESMVKETVCEMVKAEYLKEKCI